LNLHSPESSQFASANNATRQTVSAKKEVVLAAGSLHSPQLLQVSGIGDPKVHIKIGVATVVDLPAVGQNLQDHVLLTVVNSSTCSFVIFHAKHKNYHLH
jgi:choline dehydrogenase-like flavoprotein